MPSCLVYFQFPPGKHELWARSPTAVQLPFVASALTIIPQFPKPLPAPECGMSRCAPVLLCLKYFCWLSWAFTAAFGPSLVQPAGAPLWLRAAASCHRRRLCCAGPRSCSMWSLPRPGTDLCSAGPALAGRLSTARPAGKLPLCSHM